MKTSLKLSLIAGLVAVAGLAYSQGPMGGAQCDHMGGAGGMYSQGGKQDRMSRMNPAKMQAMMDKRNAALKAQLKITPAQESAWTAYTNSHKPNGATMDKQRPDPAEMAKLSTPERLDKMKNMQSMRMAEMAGAMDKHAEVTKALYAALTPEQQKMFDASAMQGHGGGHGQRAGKGPMQPAK